MLVHSQHPLLTRRKQAIVITGASGKLWRLTIDSLLKKMPASKIVAGVRRPEKAGELTALGVQLREADYARPESLSAAFAGVQKILLISSNEVGQREAQHRAVTDAAQAAGAKLLVYTSILRADSSRLALASEHKGTEEYIRASGVPYVFLRNGWYLENHIESLPAALQHGAILGSAGKGRFASAARLDYAEAAASVLLSEGHQNKIYELSGESPYTLADLAAEVPRQAGKQIRYQDMSQQEFAQALTKFGLPEPLAELLADADAGAAKGELDSSSHDLSELIGRPTTTLEAAVNAALHSAERSS